MSDRSEPATPRRLERARSEGQTALSTELSPMLLLAGLAAASLTAAPAICAHLTADLRSLLRAAFRIDNLGGIAQAGALAAQAGLRACLLPFGLAVGAAVIGVMGQTGLLIHPGALAPDLARLSLRRGLARVLGVTSLLRAVKSLAKAAIIAAALTRLLHASAPRLIEAIRRPPGYIGPALTGLATAIILTALAVQAAAAVIDLVLVRLRHARSLRMTRSEIRDDHKEASGNPEIKAKIRRLRTQRARYRMAQAVRTATVVVTNPTHYAVALAYDRSRSAAPRVVAKGMNEMAARIRALAAEHNVPLVANPPLARALHRVELESDIPAELYQAVAELIAYVWRLQGKAQRRS